MPLRLLCHNGSSKEVNSENMSYKVLTYAQLAEKMPELVTLGTLAEPQNLQRFMDLISDFQLNEGLRFVQLFRGGAFDVGLKVIFEEWANEDNLFSNEEMVWEIPNDSENVSEEVDNETVEEWYKVRDEVINDTPTEETPKETFAERMARLKKEKKEKTTKPTTKTTTIKKK